jgi:hypothetical protein
MMTMPGHDGTSKPGLTSRNRSATRDRQTSQAKPTMPYSSGVGPKRRIRYRAIPPMKYGA